MSIFSKINEKEKIDSFNLINFRTISKTESGLMSNILILVGIRNRIKVYDIFSNLLYENIIDENDSIDKIVTYHSNEGIHINKY